MCASPLSLERVGKPSLRGANSHSGRSSHRRPVELPACHLLSGPDSGEIRSPKLEKPILNLHASRRVLSVSASRRRAGRNESRSHVQSRRGQNPAWTQPRRCLPAEGPLLVRCDCPPLWTASASDAASPAPIRCRSSANSASASGPDSPSDSENPGGQRGIDLLPLIRQHDLGEHIRRHHKRRSPATSQANRGARRASG